MQTDFDIFVQSIIGDVALAIFSIEGKFGFSLCGQITDPQTDEKRARFVVCEQGQLQASFFVISAARLLNAGI